MRAGHGDENGLVFAQHIVRQFLPARLLAQAEQVVVGQHRALGVARRARGVKLQHRVVKPGRVERTRLRSGHPCTRFVGGDAPGDALHGREGIAHRIEAVAQKDRLRLGVLDDPRRLGRGEPPADRHHHDAGTRHRKEQRKVQRAVLAEPRDAIARRQPHVEQAADDAARHLFQFAVSDDAVGPIERDAVRPVFRPERDEFVEGEKLRRRCCRDGLCRRHIPVSPCPRFPQGFRACPLGSGRHVVHFKSASTTSTKVTPAMGAASTSRRFAPTTPNRSFSLRLLNVGRRSGPGLIGSCGGQ